MRTDWTMYKKKLKDTKKLGIYALTLVFSGATLATDYAGIAVDPFVDLIKTPSPGQNAKIVSENATGTDPEGSSVYYKDVMAQIAVSFDMTAESTGLIGEQIDQSSGAVSFTHTDIEIKGNSILPVSVRRVFNDTNFKQKATAEFSDWSLELPSIHTTVLMPGTANAGAWGQGLECSGYQRPGAVNYKGNVVDANQYWNGVSMLIDGSQKHLLYHGGLSSTYFTKNHWKLNCFKRADNSGEGFIAISPAGIKYTFDVPHAVRNYASSEDQRSLPIYHLYLRVSKIEDVHGNWVKYNYSSYVNSNNKTSQRLESITSNDSREITFTYDPLPERKHLIKSIIANGQTWEYQYSSDLLPTLEKVTLPSDPQNPMFWEFDLKQLSLWHNPALLPDYQEMQYQCVKKPLYVTGTIKHPNGALGKFELEPVVHGRTKVPSQIDNGSLDKNSTCFITLGLKKKTLTGPGLSDMLWNYSYSENLGAYLGDTNAGDAPVSIDGYDKKDLKTTTVTSPDGSKTISVFYRAWTYLDGQQVATIYLDTNGTTELKRQWSSYVSRPEQIGDPIVNAEFSTNNFSLAYPARLSSNIISLSGETTNSQFKTVYEEYNNYDISERWIETNKLNAIKRTTTLTLQNDTNNWVLNQETNRQISQDGESYSEHATTYYGASEDGRYLPKTESQFGKHIRTHEYYADGTLKKTTYAMTNRWVSFANYKRGKPQTITLPKRYDSTAVNVLTGVNDTGTIAYTHDLNGNKTSYAYDSLNRVTAITPADTKWAPTTISYDAATLATGALQQNIVRGQYRKSVVLDGLMQPILSKEWDNAAETDTARFINQKFNAYGKATFTSVPSATPDETYGSTTTYDGLQRVLSQTNTGNGDLSYSYGSNNSITVTNGKNYSTSTRYLAYGTPETSLATLIEQPEAATTSISYNAANLPTAITQGGTTETRRYNNKMEMCVQKRPDIGLKVFTYNALGQIDRYYDGVFGNGTHCSDYTPLQSAVIQHYYDNYGDSSGRAFGDGTVNESRTLDGNGNVLTTSSAGVGAFYQYNSLNLPTKEEVRVTSSTQITGAISTSGFFLNYDYDELGHLKSSSLSGHPGYGPSLTHIYNALGQATTVKDDVVTYAAAGKYHPNGQLKSFEYGNGLVFNQTLNNKLKPELRTVQKDNVLRMSQQYGYDDNENLDSITDAVNPVNSISMIFDGLDRLVTANGYWGNGTISYDSLGNITQKDLGTDQRTYTYDTNNRLTSVSGGYNFSYDYRGNVINNGKRAFTFNGAQRLKTSGNVWYLYDGLGRRTKKFVGNDQIYSIYNLQGQLVHISSPEGATHYIHLGKQLIAKLSPNAEYKDKSGYTGHLEDKDIDLTYMQARYYDPVIGRFYSNDPVGFNGNNPMTFNRYAYANNNPYKYTDPDGRTAIPFPLTPMDTGVGPTGMQNLTSEQQAAGVGALIDATPVVGDIKAIGEAISNPTVANIAAAAVGVVPVVGDAAAAGIKASVTIGKNANQVSHAFRHTDKAGLARDKVTDAVTGAVSEAGDKLTPGLNKMSADVGGVKVDFNAYKHEDGSINIGRITPPKE